MKRTFILLTIAATTMFFAACDKKESEQDGPTHSGGYRTISGTIGDMPTDAESYTLKAVIQGVSGDFLVVESEVGANGNFSLSFPETVLDKYLSDRDLTVSGINVNNPNAKIAPILLKLYGDDEYVDNLSHGTFSVSGTPEATLSVSSTLGTPAYSNADFTMTGTVNMGAGVPAVANVTFIQGWNWMVISMDTETTSSGTTGTGSVTSLLPGGMGWFLNNNLPLF